MAKTKNFEAKISDMIKAYKQTGKLGKASPEDLNKARQSALTLAFKEK